MDQGCREFYAAGILNITLLKRLHFWQEATEAQRDQGIGSVLFQLTSHVTAHMQSCHNSRAATETSTCWELLPSIDPKANKQRVRWTRDTQARCQPVESFPALMGQRQPLKGPRLHRLREGSVALTEKVERAGWAVIFFRRLETKENIVALLVKGLSWGLMCVSQIWGMRVYVCVCVRVYVRARV